MTVEEPPSCSGACCEELRACDESSEWLAGELPASELPPLPLPTELGWARLDDRVRLGEEAEEGEADDEGDTDRAGTEDAAELAEVVEVEDEAAGRTSS